MMSAGLRLAAIIYAVFVLAVIVGGWYTWNTLSVVESSLPVSSLAQHRGLAGLIQNLTRLSASVDAVHTANNETRRNHLLYTRDVAVVTLTEVVGTFAGSANDTLRASLEEGDKILRAMDRLTTESTAVDEEWLLLTHTRLADLISELRNVHLRSTETALDDIFQQRDRISRLRQTVLISFFLVVASLLFIGYLILSQQRIITERLAAEVGMREAKDQALAATRAKSEFLSRMSHELRTPMNAIMGYSQLLEAEQITPAQHSYVQEVLSASRHLLTLINEILNLSRIEAGKIDLKIAPVSVAGIIEATVSLVQMSAQKRGIGIQNHVTDAAWLRVLADEMRLKQVLLNLLSNAVKYNREQGSVTIYAGLIDGNHLRISIADTGQGVAPGRHDDLFQPFSRVGMEDSAIEGTGIGLSICKQLMQLMHGDIGHADNPGGGSIFWITLPLDASTPRDDATTGGAARQPA